MTPGRKYNLVTICKNIIGNSNERVTLVSTIPRKPVILVNPTFSDATNSTLQIVLPKIEKETDEKT